MAQDTGTLTSRHDRLPFPDLSPHSTALLLIDMQNGCADTRYGSCARLSQTTEGKVILDYFLDRVFNTVVPSIQQLQKAFRDASVEIIFVRIASLTEDGRDRSRQYKKLGIHYPPDSHATQILDPIRPSPGEIVLSKTSTSAFNSTNLPYILRNIGIQTLVVGGVITSGCVELNVRDACDQGFDVVLVEDACAAWTPAMHEEAVHRMDVSYGVASSCEEVIARFRGDQSQHS